MDFSVFRSERLLESLNEDALEGYIRQVVQEFSKNYRLEGRFCEHGGAHSAVHPFMGQSYKRIEFTCIDRSTGKPKSGICDLVTRHKSGVVFRLRFTAPSEDFMRMRSGFAKEVNRFTLESI